MDDLKNIVEIIGKKRYSVASSTLLAEINITSRSKYDRYIYRTAKGAYFELKVVSSGGHRLIPISDDHAMRFWDHADKQHVKFVDAFPDVKIEDA
jgi:hypothetical protein